MQRLEATKWARFNAPTAGGVGNPFGAFARRHPYAGPGRETVRWSAWQRWRRSEFMAELADGGDAYPINDDRLDDGARRVAAGWEGDDTVLDIMYDFHEERAVLKRLVENRDLAALRQPMWQVISTSTSTSNNTVTRVLLDAHRMQDAITEWRRLRPQDKLLQVDRIHLY